VRQDALLDDVVVGPKVEYPTWRTVDPGLSSSWMDNAKKFGNAVHKTLQV